MTPEVAVCMVVFDEEDYIEYSIKSIYNFASQIVIVSGSDQFTNACINFKNELRDRSHPRYNNIPIYIPDNNKTEELIKNFPDPDGKITYFNAGKVSTKIELRNICLDLLNPVEWVLLVDGDEVWKESELNGLKGKLKDTETNIFEVTFNHFFLDFKHILHVAKAERVYRNVKGIRYTKWHTEITFPKDSTREILNVGFNHYGYVRDLGKLNQKIRYGFYQRKFFYKAQYNKQFKDVDSEILKRERKWFCPNFLRENCSLFSLSEHPEVMRNHPYFEKHWMSILYRNN